jgi:hypothetical protein
MLILVWRVMPESPRWLVAKGRRAEARAVLGRLGEADADAAVEAIDAALRAEEASRRSVSWRALACPGRALRRMLLVGVGVAVAQQLSGIDAIQYFLVYILEHAGVADRTGRFLASIGLGALKLGCIVVAGRVFDRRGRKPMLCGSCAGMAVALGLLAGGFHAARGEEAGPAPGLAIAALALYFASFSFGMGPGAWLLPAEVFPQRVRARAMSLATLSNRLVATGMSTSFLSAAHALSYGGVCLALALVNLALLAFLLRYVPETKGRPLEEMLDYFCSITADSNALLELGGAGSSSSSSSSSGSGSSGGGGSSSSHGGGGGESRVEEGAHAPGKPTGAITHSGAVA